MFLKPEEVGVFEARLVVGDLFAGSGLGHAATVEPAVGLDVAVGESDDTAATMLVGRVVKEFVAGDTGHEGNEGGGADAETGDIHEAEGG